jgi:hypothetical protein
LVPLQTCCGIGDQAFLILGARPIRLAFALQPIPAGRLSAQGRI